ncbi:MAG: UDP-N-acetylmuramoyl-L-alanine--D-glutamate ligase [Candidatus Margulisiibacteriota bacterium]|jgi:UDP-N-acetylmuramoylalanine--D-glutamate ligase
MKIAILGEGITGTAVKEKIAQLSDFEIAKVEDADLIVASPGIPQEQLPKTKTEIISEIEFAYRLFKRKESKVNPKLIAVTGTNGKTTVTALLAHILDAPYAGNIGVPLISFVDDDFLCTAGRVQSCQSSESKIVVELSSYQLELCKSFKPEIAIWLNLTPDHLARHKTMAEYASVKAKVFQNFDQSNALIYLETDLFIKEILESSELEFKKIPISFNHPLINKLNQIKLIGKHNKLNALASYLAALEMGLPEEKIIEKINSFKAVEHRIEFTLSFEGREFYNDSKATNPDSTKIAVEAFDKPINLIICGKDKYLPLEEFINFLQQNVKSITIFGEITNRFKEIAHKLNPDYKLFEVNNIEEAITVSFNLAENGEVILFSPSCSSFDQFNNFEERGKIFKDLVLKKYGKS